MSKESSTREVGKKEHQISAYIQYVKERLKPFCELISTAKLPRQKSGTKEGRTSLHSSFFHDEYQ